MRKITIILFLLAAFGLNNLFYAQVPTNGLVAYYPLNGNASDMSGNGHNGTLNGATLATDRFGNSSSAFSFDGINDYIDLSNYVSDFNFQQPASVSFWVKTNSDNPEAVFSVTDGTTGYYATIIGLGNNQTGTLTNEIAVASYRSNTSDFYLAGFTTTNRDTLFDNNWHHIVYVFNDVSTSIYLDQQLLTITCNYGTNNGHYGNVTNAAKAVIGTRYANSFGCFYNGSLDDFRIYNRVLNVTEINSLYNEAPCTAPVPHAGDVAACGGGIFTLTATGG